MRRKKESFFLNTEDVLRSIGGRNCIPLTFLDRRQVHTREDPLPLCCGDPRRVRATGIQVTRDAADAGDTLITFGQFVSKIETLFPERRECKPDPDLIRGQASCYRERLDLQVDSYEAVDSTCQ